MRSLETFSRIVVKVGSSLLVNDAFELRQQWLSTLVADVAMLHSRGCRVILVSSGAIALGRRQIHTFSPQMAAKQLELRESQAAAAIGQISLSSAYSDAFSDHGLRAAQILLTVEDTEDRRRYLNAQATISTLLDWGIVPIINENDTVATSEIRYGDNDRLSARVASMMDVDLLLLLSDVDGLHTSPPALDPDAQLVERVSQVDDNIVAMAGQAASHVSSGGMKTKIDAARIATEAGIAMVIANGTKPNPIQQLDESERGTWFAPQPNSLNARKRWIAGGLKLLGSVAIDAGALLALQTGKSLLPAGVVEITGQFQRGDTVAIIGPNGHTIGRGLVEYDSDDGRLILGKQTTDIRQLLGQNIRTELIHRDNLVLDS